MELLDICVQNVDIALSISVWTKSEIILQSYWHFSSADFCATWKPNSMQSNGI